MSDPLIPRLAALAEPAPDRLLPDVLVATGIADGYVRRRGPLGDVFVAFNERGVSALDLAGDAKAFEAATARRLGRPVVPASGAPPALAARLDRAIAAGKPGRLPLDLGSLTPFQAAVLLKAAEIPRGEVRPYGWIAAEIGRPGAVRAVGSALARNPIPLIVPCHRVVRADGRFGDYSLGTADNKPLLLEQEGVDVGRLRKLADRRIRYVGSDTTRVYCHPTCRHARRITERHRVEFASQPDAARAGFRPCRDCRPRAA
jgi:O-6-methylguanine DNA methyltransferase